MSARQGQAQISAWSAMAMGAQTAVIPAGRTSGRPVMPAVAVPSQSSLGGSDVSASSRRAVSTLNKRPSSDCCLTYRRRA